MATDIIRRCVCPMLPLHTPNNWLLWCCCCSRMCCAYMWYERVYTEQHTITAYLSLSAPCCKRMWSGKQNTAGSTHYDHESVLHNTLLIPNPPLYLCPLPRPNDSLVPLHFWQIIMMKTARVRMMRITMAVTTAPMMMVGGPVYIGCVCKG